MHVMLDFVLGFAFVAMILSPAALASCLRHFSRLEPQTVPAHGASHASRLARRERMRRAS
jgi:hypothetical protein